MTRAAALPFAAALARTAALARAAALAPALAAVLAACAGKTPETHYYQLAAQAPAGGAPRGELVIALESLAVDDAYQDERIVYRTSPFRLDYYHYHRWSAPPGVLVAGYLEQALERSGRFRAVVRELTEDADVVLGGRVVAIEEIDESRTRWLGRIAIELTLKDARTGELLWIQELDETEPLAAQSPEGLARALSSAMARIAARAIPEIATRAAARSMPQRRPRASSGRAGGVAAAARLRAALTARVATLSGVPDKGCALTPCNSSSFGRGVMVQPVVCSLQRGASPCVPDPSCF